MSHKNQHHHAVTGGMVVYDPNTRSLSIKLNFEEFDGLRLVLSNKAAAQAIGFAVPRNKAKSSFEQGVVAPAPRGKSSYAGDMFPDISLPNMPKLQQIKSAACMACGIPADFNMTGTRSDFGACTVFVAVARVAGYERERIRAFLEWNSPSSVTNAERRAAKMRDAVYQCVEILKGGGKRSATS